MRRSLLSRLSTENWYHIAAWLFASFFVLTDLYNASTRLLWFDEICMEAVTRQPSIAGLWRAYASATDNAGISLHLIARIAGWAFGHNEVALRAPSLVALGAAMMILFYCVRPISDGLHGLFSMAIVGCSFVPFYGHEARPYALVFLATVCALWLWMRTEPRSGPAAILFGGAFFWAVTLHILAAALFVPFALMEARRFGRTRRPSLKLLAAAAGILAGVAVFLPQILVLVKFTGKSTPYDLAYHQPTVAKLLRLYSAQFPAALFLIPVLMLWMAWAAREKEPLPAMTILDHERLGWFFLAIPLAGFSMAQWTNVFLPRYFIATVAGVAMALPLLFWRSFRGSRLMTTGVILVLCGVGILSQVKAMSDRRIDPETLARDEDGHTRQMLALEDRLLKDKQFVLFWPRSLLYMEVTRYTKHPDRYAELVVPATAPYTTAYLRANLWTPEEMKSRARQTAFVFSDATLPLLEKYGLHPRLYIAEPLKVYVVD